MKLGKLNRKVLCAIKITIFVVKENTFFSESPCDRRWFIFTPPL